MEEGEDLGPQLGREFGVVDAERVGLVHERVTFVVEGDLDVISHRLEPTLEVPCRARGKKSSFSQKCPRTTACIVVQSGSSPVGNP